MAFLSTKDLEQLILTENCVEPYNPKRVKNASYELTLGDQVFQTNSKSGQKDKLTEKTSQVIIEPGQFALLLTEEVVRIPKNKLAFISVKFKEKKKGLVNISGFHVDPGFHGKIKFSVYNAGPGPIVLDKGQECFVMWVSDLTGECEEYEGSHQNQMNILSSDIEPLKGKIASPNALLKLVNQNKQHLVNLYWAAGIAITILSAIALNFYFKNSAYEEGYRFRIREEKLSKQIDSLTSIKVDSIIKLKTVNSDKTR